MPRGTTHTGPTENNSKGEKRDDERHARTDARDGERATTGRRRSPGVGATETAAKLSAAAAAALCRIDLPPRRHPQFTDTVPVDESPPQRRQVVVDTVIPRSSSQNYPSRRAGKNTVYRGPAIRIRIENSCTVFPIRQPACPSPPRRRPRNSTGPMCGSVVYVCAPVYVSRAHPTATVFTANPKVERRCRLDATGTRRPNRRSCPHAVVRPGPTPARA